MLLRDIAHVLSPKVQSIRAAVRGGSGKRLPRILLLSVVGGMFWLLMFGVTFRLLRYFKDVPEIGALLAGKLLSLVLISFFGLLLLSNVITSLSTFFLARDLDLLVGTPVDWLAVYCAKLVETVVNSSWMVLLMAIPIFTAYGMAYDGGWWYPLVALAAFVPYLVIPSALGAAFTLLLVNLFPARRTRDILSVLTVLTAGGVVLAFRLLRPERLARPEGFRSLVDFVAVLRAPSSPWLPSGWVQSGVLGWLRYEPDVLPFYLLWSTASALVVFGALLHRALYTRGFSKSQEGAGLSRGSVRAGRNRFVARFPDTRRELVLKEIRLFFRDTTQWSQLILLVVLVAVYVFNIRFLPLRGDGMTFFIVNVVPFLNLVLAGFVLASIAARFVFPSVSLEGRTWWLLKASPLKMRDLLWAKFWVGTLPLLILALGIIGVTNALLQVSDFMFAVSVMTITFMTLALCGMALGFGTLFPQFETENAAQIPTSFGGLVFMIASVGLIAGVITLEARPVYGYLSSRFYGTPTDAREMIVGFGLAALLCVASTIVPIGIAKRRLEAVER